MPKSKHLTGNMPQKLEDFDLTEANKVFCREYIYDWNATRSYKVAYNNVKNDDVAGAAASRLLGSVKIQSYIKEIQKELEKTAGISRLKILAEHKKLAFSSIAHLHNTWIERKEFESLTDEQKECIQEIDTKIQRKIVWEYNEDSENKEPVPYEVEYIKIKLYDKQKALDSISKMLGYDSPIKTEVSGTVTNLNITVDSSETGEALKRLRDELSKIH